MRATSLTVRDFRNYERAALRLSDGLESAETEELVLKLISPLRPGLIQSGDDGGFIYLVMPIRLNV